MNDFITPWQLDTKLSTSTAELKRECGRRHSDLESKLDDVRRRLEWRIFDLEMRILMYVFYGAIIAITLFFMLLSIANR